ncbi:MAG: hypothetical protein UW50_C0001G0184 [Candidatus Wolfebacteria bacterium GW2011_GWA1_44_24]|nr:MAG: hypothetical protein UW50_C0001G0184 [Candidatus Wolfebacteria bacterium GW2011_GWA1_44_24]
MAAKGILKSRFETKLDTEDKTGKKARQKRRILKIKKYISPKRGAVISAPPKQRLKQKEKKLTAFSPKLRG